MAPPPNSSALYIVPIATSAFLSGAIASLSFAVIPALTSHLRTHPPNSPTRASAESHTLTIFRHVYEAGKASAPLIAVVSTSLCWASAYRLYSTTALRTPVYTFASWQYAMIAGVLNLAIAPFTILVIAPTNERLFAREEAARAGGGGGEEKVRAIEKREGGVGSEAVLGRWMWLNLARAVFPAVGAVAAWMAC